MTERNNTHKPEREVPEELIEAARLDRASELKIICRIMLPIARPTVTTLALLTFISSWNDYFWPLVFWIFCYNVFSLSLNGHKAFIFPFCVKDPHRGNQPHGAAAYDGEDELQAQCSYRCCTVFLVELLFFMLPKITDNLWVNSEPLTGRLVIFMWTILTPK